MVSISYNLEELDEDEKAQAKKLLEELVERLKRKTKIQSISVYFKKHSRTGEKHKYSAIFTIFSDNNQKHEIEVVEWGLQYVFNKAQKLIERLLIDKKKD